MKRLFVLLVSLMFTASSAFATSHSPAPKADASMTPAEVRKVDKEAGKVTLKHGPIASLDMPAMTMVFRVKDPTMLDKLKAGDSITFKAEKIGGNYTVTEYQAAK